MRMCSCEAAAIDTKVIDFERIEKDSRQILEIKNGQLAIPEKVLAKMGLKNGDMVEISQVGSTLFIVPAQFSNDLDDEMVEELIRQGLLIG